MSEGVQPGRNALLARMRIPVRPWARRDMQERNLGDPRDHRLPPKPMVFREAAAWCVLRARIIGPEPRRPREADCDRPPVLVLPGFLGNDSSTKLFRERLAMQGWDVYGWGDDLNRGACRVMLRRVEELVETISGDGKCILIGWSLGGLYAREVAKLRPHQVDRVVTLGTPFSGNARSNNMWKWYERVAGHPVDQMPFELNIREKPPVPTVALWSRGDGIVAPACARGMPGEADRSIEVRCTHVGYMGSASVVRTVLELLAD